MNKGASPTGTPRTDTIAAPEGRLVALAGQRVAEMAEKDDAGSTGEAEEGKFGPSMIALADGFTPGEYDVICGRGKTVWKHTGNKNFRAYVETQVSVYEAATTKLDKSNILSAVVAEVRKRSPKGGFVKKDTVTGRWYEVGDFLAREKTSQAFRDVLHDSYRSSNKTKKKRRVEEQNKVAAQNYKMQRLAFQRLNAGFAQPTMFEMLAQQNFLNNVPGQAPRPALREDFTSNAGAIQAAGNQLSHNPTQTLMSFASASNQAMAQASGATSQGLQQTQMGQHQGGSFSMPNALGLQGQGFSMNPFAAASQTPQAGSGQLSEMVQQQQQQQAGLFAQLGNLSRAGLTPQQQQQFLLLQQQQQQLMLQQQQQQLGQQLVSGLAAHQPQGTSSSQSLGQQMQLLQMPGQTQQQQLNSLFLQQGQSSMAGGLSGQEQQALQQLGMPNHIVRQNLGMPAGHFSSGYPLDSFAQNLAVAVQQSPQGQPGSAHDAPLHNPFEPTPLDEHPSGTNFEW